MLIALTAGTVLGGIVGAVLAVPLTATAWGIIQVWDGPATPARWARRKHRTDERAMVSGRGAGLRASVESMLSACLDDRLGTSPWLAVLEAAEESGEVFDAALVDGGPIDFDALSPETRDAWLTVAASIARRL